MSFPTSILFSLFALLLLISQVHGDVEGGGAQPAPEPPDLSVDGLTIDEEELPPPAPDSALSETWVAGGEVIDIPHPHVPPVAALLESIPTVLSWPDKCLGKAYGHLLHAEHDLITAELSDFAIHPQPIPPRPPLLVEWNERFLSPGFLKRGIELPTGAVWRPALWVFGQYRTAVQYEDFEPNADAVSEWANRLDLFGQVNLTGTERLLIGVRPFDEERGNRREFVGYDFGDGRWRDGWNSRIQTLFFEGDIGELFPSCTPCDFIPLDWGFSVGRMPLLAQQGLLINEDMIDAVTLTRDTLSGNGILDLRVSGVYAWRGINRNSPTTQPNDFDPDSRLVALLTEADFYRTTVNLDVAYVYGNDVTGDLLAFGASAIQRLHGYHNTYNTSLNLLSSHPTDTTTPYADRGVLAFGQLSWTPHRTHDLIYLNGYWAIDQFTSPARGPLQGGPLGQTGILFSAAGVGRFGAPLNVRTDNTAGASLGYQLFFDHTRSQVITEIGGFKETKGDVDRGTIGTAIRFQRAVGQHSIFILDGVATRRESENVAPGARCEWLIKF